ncbi:hypothetical protein TH25_21335 [Thalassospira profundimaris]|uniref:Uncharacterized protein n=1 Tax=Thalassospira profundimaris TaxID=502049 RepID=A0A367WPY1_9PROT|nr:hypothetical protein TH25_21335 [Thalassospira profundimaris]
MALASEACHATRVAYLETIIGRGTNIPCVPLVQENLEIRAILTVAYRLALWDRDLKPHHDKPVKTATP